MSEHFRNDGQTSETELATRIVGCPACDAMPGTGCKHGDSYASVYAEPHYGRVELLRALAHYVRASIPKTRPAPVRPSDTMK